MKPAAILFAIAALGGATLAYLRVSNGENPPTWMAVAHGLVAATALASLVVAAVQYPIHALAKAALATFVVAAIAGGFLFFAYQMTGSLLPIPMILLHGGLALTAFTLLLAALFAREPRRIR